ncbi:DUF1883 domain-containing protein [Alkalicoccus halolimnae]|uniref:DUF1883 domain-containing protein n=1 Tax=Alkalicoccus halolimnae TaxID=1667239 RepID=A0A5C7FIE7_9BACI|nr:DUF1883 domain-containing protein [Alkalicoccus halolimnae]TXF85256.1 DUF1883 domain-containing protein [Alkalicoccus halolimnae]
MKYRYVERYLYKDQRVRVYLDSEAKVLLMDLPNFRKYRENKPCFSYGGMVKKSPAYLKVPHNGFWYVVVESPVKKGTVRYTVSIG